MTHTLYKYGTTWFDHFRLPDDIQITEDDKEILWTMKPDKPQQITLFGKKMNTPRLQEAFGKSYTFSGSKFESTKPIPELCDRLIKKFNKLYRTEFNMVLINWYRDGDDYISMHSDYKIAVYGSEKTDTETDYHLYTYSFINTIDNIYELMPYRYKYKLIIPIPRYVSTYPPRLKFDKSKTTPEFLSELNLQQVE